MISTLVLCYGSDALTLTYSTMKIMNAFERKVLHRILGAVFVKNGWCIRYNELYEIYGKPEV